MVGDSAVDMTRNVLVEWKPSVGAHCSSPHLHSLPLHDQRCLLSGLANIRQRTAFRHLPIGVNAILGR